jgi:glycosyltransferase involved in cell wall biosynthesis
MKLERSAAVSVIIPTYNRAGMIGTAIDSVLRQSYKDVEVIVVDDGSTDNTEAIVHAYGDAVTYLRTEHGGVAHARNVGMRAARGEFVTFLDSDDEHYPYTLELQTSLLKAYPAVDLVCSEMSAFDDNGFFERYHLKTYHRSAYRNPELTYDRFFSASVPLVEAGVMPERLVQDDPGSLERRAYFGHVFDTYLLNLVLCQNSVMLRRSILSSVGERNEAIQHWQEVDFLLRICRTHHVCFADVPTYKLRYHPGQISTTDGPDGKQVWLRKQRILLRVVKRHAMSDRAYYLRHKSRIDTHLAHLNRAVAVPLMLVERRSVAQRYARRARRYLTRCRKYGAREPILEALTFAPGPIRRLSLTIIERLRHDGPTTLAAARAVMNAPFRGNLFRTLAGWHALGALVRLRISRRGELT